MKARVDDLRAQMAWFRRKIFGSMSEKRLPMDPSVMEPTLFDEALPEEEQVRRMEEENAHVIEEKAHRREVRTPVTSHDLRVEVVKDLYPEEAGNPDYIEIGVETAIRPLVVGRLCCTPHNLPYVGNAIMLAS